MNKQYLVTLTESERASLGQRIAAGSASARDLIHARILLKADDGPNGPAWTDAAIADGAGREHLDHRAGSQALRRAGPGGRDPPPAASPRVPTEAGRRAGGPPGRPGLHAATRRAPTLDPAAAGRQDGRAAVHRRRLVRDRAPGAQEEPPQAVAHEALVHPARAERRVRLADGGRPGGLHPPVRPDAGRWSASTRPARSSSRMPVHRAWRSRASRPGTTTSTSGTGPPTCSWSPSRSEGGGTSR